MTRRTNSKHASNPLEYAYLSMADRVNRIIAALTDPYVSLDEDKKEALLSAAVAIEQEWIIKGVNADFDDE